ncbi:MAG: peptidase [Cypionkella sp.]|uniref:LysM peptidoglycan-binding domain-containing M23 family metallopeptidase n=1 Tax=Cypionkella sp. TaxID=2811411 RepID=UPI002636727A|nr:LysM peptidoglycan-binding domain-containing M23 family metallopeptidase [Cypionkella sp.]MDB5661280.1 peptidase [Cypionkella sp.]MDB5666758.1 peptidase [Cypionkella sp.]
MTLSRIPVLGLSAVLLISACSNSRPFDWDLRAGNGSLDTSDAALRATDPRPTADARGVLSYPTYQAAVAQRGDTVASVAGRVGLPADQLAQYNGLKPTDSLREGETLALPNRVAAAPTASTAAPGAVDVSSIATTALDRVGTTATPAKPAAATNSLVPIRHQVKRGETAFSIARIYNISARSIADWNGLGPDLEVREGQFLIIPTANAAPPPKDPVAITTVPGAGSPTPEPPSAKKPLPAEKPAKATEKPAPAADLGKDRTAASASRFAMPVNGKVIRAYAKKKNDGIDIAAAAGSSVKSAADGTIAAITKDTTGTPIVVIRHADGILTVYAGVDGLKVAKGDKVTKGQNIAVVRAGDPAFVHFEVRKGVDSVDPMAYLQ